MMKDQNAHPLAWPLGWERTPHGKRESGRQFKEDGGRGFELVTLETARKKLIVELRKLHCSSATVSSNVPLRTKNNRALGEPGDFMRVPQDDIEDPGFAVYFTMGDRELVIACDRYHWPAANLRSIGLAIAAMRQLERHGGGALMQRAFAGFAALPAPVDWRKVLGFGPQYLPTPEELATAHRKAAKTAHPDHGGSSANMAAVNTARDVARVELGFS